MAERQTRFGGDPLVELQREQEYDVGGVPHGHAIMPSRQGDTAINIADGMVTAQRVAVPRDLKDVQRRLVECADLAGDTWMWGWEVNDKKNNRKNWVEGPTIKMANDIVREYGNCMVNIRVQDDGRHLTFYGRFVDLERGFSTERPFQQRKNQNTGMGDSARAADMIYQIGISKCFRNVVVNALQHLVYFCEEQSKDQLRARVSKDPEKARSWALRRFSELGVDIKDAERAYGKAMKNWTVVDLCKVYREITSVDDGMILAIDVWPTEEVLKEREKEAAKAELKGDVTGDSPAPKETAPTKEGPSATQAEEKPEAAPQEQGAEQQKEDGKTAPAEQPAAAVNSLFVVKNERGSVIGTMRDAPEVGSEFPFNDIQMRCVEVTTEGEPTVVVKPAPKPSAADKASAAAKKAAAGKDKPPAEEKKAGPAGPSVNMFDC